MKTFFVVNTFLIFTNCLFFLNSSFIANLIKLNDYPDNLRKIHNMPVPLLGGMVLFFNITINLFFFLLLEIINLKLFLGHFFFLFGFFLLGIIDDYKSIRPKFKLLFSILMIFSFLLIFSEYIITSIDFTSFNKVISLGYFSIPFTILCFLLLQNAMNMIDGIDGLLGSVSIAILLLCFLYNNFENTFLTYYILSLIIFLIIYIFFNFKKKSFLGDSGAFILALSISIIIVSISNEKNLSYFQTNFRTEQIFLLLLLPGIDMFRVFILRVSLNKNPFYPDKNHLHHYLLNYLNRYKICLIYFLFIFISNFLVNIFPTKTLLILTLSAILYLTILVSSRKFQSF